MKSSSWRPWALGATIAVCAVAGVGATLVAAQPGSGSPAAASTPSTGRAAPTATTTLPATTTAGSAGAAAAPARSSARAPASPATTARPAHPSATAAPSVSPPTTRAPVAAGPAPAAVGTYRYRQSGSLSGTPAEGTLVVAPGTAPGTQRWTRAVGGSVAATTTVMSFNASGSFLVAPGGSGVGAAPSCTFSTPLPWPPWPTTAGTSLSGHATCSGPVSSYQVSEVVTAPAAVSFGGATISAAVVVNTIVIGGSYAGSALRVTLTETDYYAPALRVPVVTKTHLSGSVLGLSVTTDRTDTLESATPS